MGHKEVSTAKILKFRGREVVSCYYFYVSILNLKHICVAYGEGCQVIAFQSLVERLESSRISRRKIKVLSSSTVLIDPGLVPFNEYGSKAEFMLDVIYGEPVIIGGTNIVLSVELGCVNSGELLFSDKKNKCSCVDPFFTEVLVPPCVAMKSWKETYQDKMESVHRLYSRPFGESYKFMPVSYSHSPELVLFDEVLLDSDLDLSNEAIFGVLESTGTVSYLEFRLFEKVIDILSRDQFSSVSMNVSLSNFYWNAWWEQVVDFLEGNPALARRVYFEITETLPFRFNEFRREKRLVESIKLAGSHLVVDDFGSGFSGFGCVDFLEPEIIKIDKKTLHAARNGQKYFNTLKAIVRYSMEQCGFCVVEGVESENDLFIVESVGANLIQGKYLQNYSRVEF
ncbi:EAL domain-containing protein [Pseudomonas aeruginosa]|uniref:EAL domain-containing protein n=1 Tax=Pseudomonas aeruginosa TaxID=287 RepID=UPI001F325CF4|nr:EAL domain-containing protein [Pseudomonas aeruginosa]MDG3687170.1 EAL domain-containing protein [Pseudomonas aeruginosa]MDG3716643.1 EAL domain-containing protein [Pseudomonas aeruginosa]